MAATAAPFRTQVNHVVGPLDDIQIVFDDHHGVAPLHQTVQDLQQLVYVVGVQAGGGLIQDIDGLSVERRASSVASFTRWASPPDSVVEDWPIFR